jgi:tetratricopeptide (TPR) repeat protein
MAVAWSAAMAQSFERAEFHFDLASELNPNDPKILVSASLGLAFMGCTEQAMKLLDHALMLTSLYPDYQWSHIATIRYLGGDFIGAIEAANRSKNLILDTPGWKAAALQKLGRSEESRASIAQLHKSVASAWAGPSSPSPDDVINWFLGAFPLRRETDRMDLAATLGAH